MRDLDVEAALERLLDRDESAWHERAERLYSDSDLPAPSTLIEDVEDRIRSITFSLQKTLHNARKELEAAVDEMSLWMKNNTIVRVVGAGRARLAAAFPANRLHHAGARVYVIGDTIPFPNSRLGGAVLASSASGNTPEVLSVMRKARVKNQTLPENDKIRVIGIAAREADEFASLCDIFVPIDSTRNPFANPLRALADQEELIIAEILDAIIVAAALKNGMTDVDFRKGHEDLGPSGPYDVQPLGAQQTGPFSVAGMEQESFRKLLSALGEAPHVTGPFLDDILATILFPCPLDVDTTRTELLRHGLLARVGNEYFWNQSAASKYTSMQSNPRLGHHVLLDALLRNPSDSPDWHARALEHSLAVGDYYQAFELVLENSCISDWRRKGKSKEALAIVDRLASHLERFDPRRQAQIMHSRAELQGDLGALQDARNALMFGLGCMRGIRDTNDVWNLRRILLKSLGTVSGDLGDVADAIVCYREALRIDPHLTELDSVACAGYLAYLYTTRGEFELAQSWMRLAMEACPEERDANTFCKTLCNAGLVHLFANDLQEAESSFHRALEIARRPLSDGGDLIEEGHILTHQIMISFAKGDPPAMSVACADSAIEACSRVGDRRRLALAQTLRAIAAGRIAGVKSVAHLFEAVELLISVGDLRNALLAILALFGVSDSMELFASPSAVVEHLKASRQGDWLCLLDSSAFEAYLDSEEAQSVVQFWNLRLKHVLFPR